MGLWNRLSHRIGAMPARKVTWGLVMVFSAWVILDVFVFRLTGGLTQSTYDAMVRARLLVPPADARIVVVDIDEASLARMGKEFGRWPWPRDTLAAVLGHIERQQPAAVVWDILFSDADRLSPGGDAAFDAAARQSVHSHFSVVRLPQSHDVYSQLDRSALPGLWVGPGLQESDVPAAASPAKVALIPPALPAVANGRLGYNNGYVDADGVLRRYRYLERLPDGSAVQSLPFSVLSAMDPRAAASYLKRLAAGNDSIGELIVWPRRADAYPHVAFADVFAQADGGKPLAPVPSFAGKVVILGATAPSLYDIHPTPLSNMQAGVDSLATVLDNALNQRHLRELPRGLQAALAITLCIGLALWVQFRSAASLAPALLVLPAALVGVSYLSLNGAPLFVDLHLSAALALAFLAVLRFWSSLRRIYWCTPPVQGPLLLLPLQRNDAWLEGALDRLIDSLERYAPQCRVLAVDSTVVWPATLRWPELARYAAIVGPQSSLQQSLVALLPVLERVGLQIGELQEIGTEAPEGHPVSRSEIARCAYWAWAQGHADRQARGCSTT